MKSCCAFLLAIGNIIAIVSNEEDTSSESQISQTEASWSSQEVQDQQTDIETHEVNELNSENMGDSLDTTYSKVKRESITRENLASNKVDLPSGSFDVIEIAHELGQVESSCNLNKRLENSDSTACSSGAYLNECKSDELARSRDISDRGAPLEFNISCEDEIQSGDIGHDECGTTGKGTPRSTIHDLILCKNCMQYKIKKFNYEICLRELVRRYIDMLYKYEGDSSAEDAFEALQRYLYVHNIRVDFEDETSCYDFTHTSESTQVSVLGN